MNIKEALSFLILYYSSEEFEYANEDAKEEIKNLVDSAEWLLEKYQD